MTKHKKEPEDWMQKKWRPAMGWMYMGVCIFDFVFFPILWSALQALNHGQVTSQWQPLTLQGAGLFHLAMGAVLGIAAHGRTQEKISGAENGNIQPQPSNTFISNTPAFGSTSSTGFETANNFNTPNTGFGDTVPSSALPNPVVKKPIIKPIVN